MFRRGCRGRCFSGSGFRGSTGRLKFFIGVPRSAHFDAHSEFVVLLPYLVDLALPQVKHEHLGGANGPRSFWSRSGGPGEKALFVGTREAEAHGDLVAVEVFEDQVAAPVLQLVDLQRQEPEVIGELRVLLGRSLGPPRS